MNDEFLSLFILRHGRGGKPVYDSEGHLMVFNNKMEAKDYRQSGQVVSFGPDHRRFMPHKGEVL